MYFCYAHVEWESGEGVGRRKSKEVIGNRYWESYGKAAICSLGCLVGDDMGGSSCLSLASMKRVGLCNAR